MTHGTSTPCARVISVETRNLLLKLFRRHLINPFVASIAYSGHTKLTPRITMAWDLFPKWGLECQKEVSRAGTSNYIPQYLWDVITSPCPGYFLLAHKYTNASWIRDSNRSVRHVLFACVKWMYQQIAVLHMLWHIKNAEVCLTMTHAVGCP